MASWSPGTRIGFYEIVDVLGHGGMGQVYRVRHLITNRTEAMKVIVSDHETSQEMLERFNREIQVLAGLSHPNIAALHNAFHHDDRLIMVMEHVEGTDLSRRLVSGITLDQALDFARQILSALDYAHSNGVIHRDIKPSNIMVTPSCRIKLLDFGLALRGPDTRITTAGGLVGSMHYVSPEQLSGHSADARSDLYAAGITIYEMITGSLPIQGDSYAQIIANHLQRTPAPPSRVNPQIPEAISLAVMKALAKERRDRWQSASEFLRALDAQQLGDAGRFLVTTTTAVIPPSVQSAGNSGAGPSVPQPSATPASASRSAHRTEVLGEIAARLANHVGPIANVLVKRASSNAHDLRELCDLVAKEIESPDARQKFLASVQGHLRASGYL